MTKSIDPCGIRPRVSREAPMLTALDNAAFYAAGLASWTVLEYGIHRVIGHEGKFSRYGYDRHQHHHRFPQGEGYEPGQPAWNGDSYLEGLKHLAPLAAPVMGGLNAVFVPVLGLRRAMALSAGILTGWLIYEKIHQDIHKRGPQNIWEQWAWKHHMAHHFKSPKSNHGVTTALWDKIFGTLVEPEEVAIPASVAPPWLLNGEHPGFRIKGAKAAPKPGGETVKAKKKPSPKRAA